jgi:hydrogenase nickel incorporation protein HypB
MFRTAQLCLINKMDLLPYLKFDLDALKRYALQVNPELTFIELSATTGQGMEQWYAWIKEQQLNPHSVSLDI